MAVILLLAAGGSAWYFLIGKTTLLATAAADTTPDYQTATVKRGSLRVSASGTGTLVAKDSVDLSFTTGGAVSELKVKLGDRVTKGEELAKLGNTETLEANVASCQLQTLQAQQALDDFLSNADVTLAEAYQAWVTARQTYSDAVTAEQRMAYPRCSQQTNTDYKAALDAAQAYFDQLSSCCTGSDEWQTARIALDKAQANYSYCIAYTSEEKTEASASVQVAAAALKQAETKYNTLKSSSGVDAEQQSLLEAKVENAKTSLAEAQKQLAGVTLVAPIDGVIT